MTGSWGWDLLLGVAAALALTWVALVAVLVAVRPRGDLLREALRLLPDVLRLVRRLAADPELPRGVRIRLALLLAYLAFPLDLVPDFIPVLGYADDAIVVTATLRSVVRRAGLPAVRRHWPGTEDGFAVLCRLTGLTGLTEGPGRVHDDAARRDPGA
ncbi:YkvA family protein [Streptosporangium sandarakinum]|uniref:YkvA family protein n=1 Tax=Streptosporangium sandarakinum TaxID=1260955 RepID=UPI00339F531F